jgi:hypothetical protein
MKYFVSQNPKHETCLHLQFQFPKVPNNVALNCHIWQVSHSLWQLLDAFMVETEFLVSLNVFKIVHQGRTEGKTPLTCKHILKY